MRRMLLERLENAKKYQIKQRKRYKNRITNIKVTSILAWCNKVVYFLTMSVVVVPRFWYE